MPSAAMLEKTAELMHEGLLKNHQKSKDKKYKVGYDDLKIKRVKGGYGGGTIDRKSWYYAIYFPGNWLGDTHVELGMYFLRMKAEQYKLRQKFTTADPMFMPLVKQHYENHISNQMPVSESALNKNIMCTILGTRLDYALPWAEAEHVYMPLNTGNHWILLVLDIGKKCIRVYDSIVRREQTNIHLHHYLPSMQMYLPRLMDKLGVYNERTEGPIRDDFLQIHMVKECPQQNDSDSCGMFVLKMAEYLMMGKDVEYVRPEDINAYRSKMTTELLTYFGVIGA
ncbi:unnamed protein product [Cuscuta epithymum]|uniref:Ubiquitin-like protease family profile domain-containing protein n=3 Tax=Cuscuta epithymum TaxID=186058 RepID=A0AAV0DJF2_9ASTE|nr:unnamed protein product [Cuscuta epithymum]